MKRFCVFFCILLGVMVSSGQSNLFYFLPGDVEYDPAIPEPASFIGFGLGDRHVSHELLYFYMREIAELSDRVILEEYGRSYENRPLVQLVFTSPDNHRNLQELRQRHLDHANPSKPAVGDLSSIPLVVRLGYSVHGNESSAANSALLTAYYLAAARGPRIDELLSNTIILVDPCLNPDGLTRHSAWVNMNQGQIPVPDPNSRGFSEAWPGGRTNHYWFDLNRDYLLLVNPETRGRVKAFHEWKPNLVTDHHEMGANSTFFFQPGIPSRNNPWTPQENYMMTGRIADFHARALDRIGSLYFSEEVFDDFYFGKGSSYPDINGSVGILFEQAGFRGRQRETTHGFKSFAFAIRNQFTVTLSSLEAARSLHNDLLRMQRGFYSSALALADKDAVKAIVFGDPHDRTKTLQFLELLRQHQIEVFELRQALTAEGKAFSPGSSYLIPLKQPQYRLIKSMFETVTEFRDSSFYDVSTWTLQLSFNMPAAELKTRDISACLGKRIEKPEPPAGKVIGGKSSYAYLFKWNDFNSPALLYQVLDRGLRAAVATNRFTFSDESFTESFGYGTILVPVAGQVLDAEQIHDLMQSLAGSSGIDIYGISTGLTGNGIDMGSESFEVLKKPKVLLLTGAGTSSSQAGEVWHLFDTRIHLPLTLVDADKLGQVNLFEYTTLIMPGGSYAGLDKTIAEKLRTWLASGGVVIACQEANRWLATHELAPLKFKPPAAPRQDTRVSFANREKLYSMNLIPGAILNTHIDPSHPLFFGYQQKMLPVYKIGTLAVERPANQFACPACYSDKPLMSGFISEENLERVRSSPFVVLSGIGRGNVVSILDHTNFRGVWFGTSKIMANAVFFGELVR